jgi:hypothetical protein
LWKIGLGVGILLISLSLVAFAAGWALWSLFRPDRPRLAPEADTILQAQANLPFQVLIPAYLPAKFNRSKVEILTGQPGPQGETMLQLVYSAQDGEKITITEYVPAALNTSNTLKTSVMASSMLPSASTTDSSGASSGVQACTCACKTQNTCNITTFMINAGPLHVMADISSTQVMTRQQIQAVLETLSPAADLLTYTTIQDVPITYSLPPAVEVPVNESGVQELVLIVTPQGYTPAHFSVTEGTPVRIIFRQLGDVACGNEMIITWGSGHQATLILKTPDDKQTLEFTPDQAGDFQFNCPYLHYIGVMTVLESAAQK